MTRSSAASVIALDGPGGAGKSTVARLVATETGLPFLDTGAMYRAITFSVLQRDIEPSDWPSIDQILDDINLELSTTAVVVDGTIATEAIRGPEVTNNVSAVAANPKVRTAMVRLQREWIEQNQGGVLEGRDIGTVVVPDAGLKVFVTASVRERARRRAVETGASIEDVEADLIRRDKADSERETAPLRAADDAVEVDTTGHTIEEVVAIIVDLARERDVI